VLVIGNEIPTITRMVRSLRKGLANRK